jgi:hypothetical protein
MSLQDLSLPVDVPWRLIATSPDMLATKKSPFPHAMWRSSIAVFAYQPDLSDLADEFPDRQLTFLKVACSITSYTPPCVPFPTAVIADKRKLIDELTKWETALAQLRDQAAAAGDPSSADYFSGLVQAVDEAIQTNQSAIDALVADWERQVHRSLPCAGALVQVALYPADGSSPLANGLKDLAYFLTFEPKKRETIEAVTESGEALTQSKSDLNVRKGVTSTDSTEESNLLTGVNAKVEVGGVGGGFGVEGRWGTVKRSTSEQIDTTTTDSSRELRDTASHTTSLSQLYHVLNSYHLGTNRAIFFVQPRPHTVQQKDLFTFIDGPQQIEGIQEFFLVVSHPKKTEVGKEYCVDALLYTGHLDADQMRASVMEPQTAETPWMPMFAKANKVPDNGGLTTADYVANIFTGGLYAAFSDPVGTVKRGINTIQNDIGELQSLWQDVVVDTVLPAPTMFDKCITPAGLNDQMHCALVDTKDVRAPRVMDNGWRIDRTRGLGGYDLWESPWNRTASPLGEDDGDAKQRPQAYVDVLSLGNPNDSASYLPDYALRVRVEAWASTKAAALYFGRIKAYFIRNEQPSDHRTVDMIVAVRNANSCSQSPFADSYKGALLFRGETAEIVSDQTITPPSVSPWKEKADQTTMSVETTVSTSDNPPAPPTPPQPTGPTRPSGLTHAAIGAARAKMANSMSGEVRSSLRAEMNCLDKRDRVLIGHLATDRVFKLLAKHLITSEISRLAPFAETERSLAAQVASHPQLRFVLGSAAARMATMLTTPRAAARTNVPRAAATGTARPARVKRTVKVPPQLREFSVLTLTHQNLTRSDRRVLSAGGIETALDLVGVKGSSLATQLGVSEIEARAIRLRALGVPTPPRRNAETPNGRRGTRE